MLVVHCNYTGLCKNMHVGHRKPQVYLQQAFVILVIGTVKIHDEKPQWNAQAKVPTKADARAKKTETSPPDAKRRITHNKLDLR
jgi:hypothetical protein